MFKYKNHVMSYEMICTEQNRYHILLSGPLVYVYNVFMHGTFVAIFANWDLSVIIIL